MTRLLLRLFVKNPDTPDGRARVGSLAGTVGIVCNLLLFLGKVTAGALAGSVAIAADGWNNLSDAASSIVTVVGFRFSRKPADAHHPYGHARAEYLSGLWVAVLILFIGLELVKSSVSKIIDPEPVEFSALTLAVLLSSIGMKLWMSIFVGKLGKLIDSRTLSATSADSRNDVIATSAVLLSCLIGHFLHISVDGWMGLSVAAFILWSGYGIARETMSALLGEKADGELVQKIEAMVLRHKGILGIHDLMVHDYGLGRCFASAHVELSAEEDPLVCHERIDHLECDALRELNVHLVIHHDPVPVNDAEWGRLREQVERLAAAVDGRLSVHSFRLVRGRGMPRLVFDLATPYGMDQEAVRQTLREKMVEDGITNPVTIRFDEQ
ncbi:MAG: cation transporter [Oscillospiraceae bacterium]|nr:cation transporter [Oscillospiraceae bacterium]